MIRRSPLLFLAVIAGIALMAPAAAEACTCATGPTSCRELAAADAVFEATVASLESAPAGVTYSSARLRRVSLTDVKSIRGASENTVVTPWATEACGYDFKPGTRYLVVAHRGSDGRLAVYMCGETRPLSDAKAQLEYLATLGGSTLQTRVWGLVLRTSQLPWVDFSPTPVAGARITLKGPVERTTTSDAAGRFLMVGMPHGSYSIEASIGGKGSPAVRSWPSRFEWQREEPFACAAIGLAIPTAGRISGTMQNEFGEPIHNATALLHAVDPATQMPGALLTGVNTDPQGRYSFSELPPGRYITTVNWMTGPTFVAPHPVTIAPTGSGSPVITLGQDDARTLPPMQLERLAAITVHGIVRDQTGLPVAGAQVGGAGLHHNNARFPIARTVASGADGTFQLVLWRGQRYVIDAVVGGRQTSVELVASAERITITVPR